MENVDIAQSETLNKILNQTNILNGYRIYVKAYSNEGKMALGVHSDEILSDAILKQVYKKISAIYLGQLGRDYNKASKIILVPTDVEYDWHKI